VRKLYAQSLLSLYQLETVSAISIEYNLMNGQTDGQRQNLGNIGLSQQSQN